MRRLTLMTALLAVGVAAPAQAATKVRTYQPWDEIGNPKVKRYTHGSATCAASSRRTARSDAWRCVSGNVAYDPCFQSPTDEEVFCVNSPWARRGSLLGTLLEPSTRRKSPAKLPWALQVGKRRCVVVPKRTKRRRATYRCGRRGYLFGRPNKRKKTWTIRAAKSPRGKKAKRAKIRVAWR